jgi:hypothetical protein
MQLSLSAGNSARRLSAGFERETWSTLIALMRHSPSLKAF